MSVGFHKINNGRGAAVSGAATALALAGQVRRDPLSLAQLERARHAPSAAVTPTPPSPSAAVSLTAVALQPALAVLRRCVAELEALCSPADVAPPPLMVSDTATLRRHCQRLGMTVTAARGKLRRRELVSRRWALMVALHGEGWTQTRIAAALHCNHGTVGHALRRTNYQSTIINES